MSKSICCGITNKKIHIVILFYDGNFIDDSYSRMLWLLSKMHKIKLSMTG